MRNMQQQAGAVNKVRFFVFVYVLLYWWLSCHAYAQKRARCARKLCKSSAQALRRAARPTKLVTVGQSQCVCVCDTGGLALCPTVI